MNPRIFSLILALLAIVLSVFGWIWINNHRNEEKIAPSLSSSTATEISPRNSERKKFEVEPTEGATGYVTLDYNMAMTADGPNIRYIYDPKRGAWIPIEEK